MLCGKNSVLDALENNVKIEMLYVLASKVHEFKHIKNIKIEVKDKQFLDSLVKENHQGYVAVLKSLNFVSLDQMIKSKETILILDHLEDPYNFGAILRSANAFGIKNIIYPIKRAVDINSTVLKVSSGGFVNLRFYKSNSISATIDKLKKQGYWIYSSSLDPTSEDINKISFNNPSVLVIGNEKKGISQTTKKQSDQLFYIKTKGSVQSLNASVAAGIIFNLFTKE
ncbi:23S rRNA (guanosine(2251)-2'-O)-methyltransferase RlmB [Mycoplasmopsis pulmonis]|nr:23S rRNA (guanosine(2251)-2'-O)-methyltransferase RlmB [Mycoplasmopsis pulmonis]MDZ7293145.1 23S rRNA (guanosine(2251)-2'-O)-methyltransferase RlmB [Mycoplasmopsis pulmonis]